MSDVAAQVLPLGLLALLVYLVSDAVWALAASRLRKWLEASPRRAGPRDGGRGG